MIPRLVDIGSPWKVLPPGVHDATLQKIEDVFATNNHRIYLYNGFKGAVKALCKAGCKTIYLDGSFVTGTPLPRDDDACWYLPCSGNSLTDGPFLLEANYIIEPGICTNICTTVNKFTASGNSTITTGEIKDYISCPGASSGGGGTPNPPPSPPAPAPPPTPTNKTLKIKIENFIEKNKFWIIGGIILIILLIIFTSYSRNKTK